MIKVLTTVCMSVAITIATVFPTASTGFGQEKVISLPAESVTAKADKSPAPELWRQVEIIRTAHGVPHIRAENLRAAGYALGWLQLEDYGPRAPVMALRARGEMAKVFGLDSMESDFENRRNRSRTVATYPRLEQATRDVYEGFAAGMNRYIALHAEEFPAGMPANFTGYDVAARDMGGAAGGGGGGSRFARFISRLNPPSQRDTTRQSDGEGGGPSADIVGSNAWAFAPSRTKSGKAILLRNPHLQW